MAVQLDREHMQRLARLGAIKRLEEIRKEEASLRAAFPEIFRGAGRAMAMGAPARGRRKPMSAAEKKAVSERMKRYWAERRKAKR